MDIPVCSAAYLLQPKARGEHRDFNGHRTAAFVDEHDDVGNNCDRNRDRTAGRFEHERYVRHSHIDDHEEKVMKRTIVLLLTAIAAAACASVGPEKTDNPHITPTSLTGVTSARGTNVYEKIPAATSTAR